MISNTIIKEGNMSLREDAVIREILSKLDIVVTNSADNKTSIEVIKTKLNMIDSRGCSKSNEQINSLNSKINYMAGGVAALSMLFPTLLTKLGLK